MPGRRIKGLYAREKGGVAYYSYRHPISKKEVSLGTNRKAAEQAVLLAAGRLAPNEVQRALNRIEAPICTWGDHVDWFLDEHLPGRRSRNGLPLAAATMDVYRYSLAKADGWRDRGVDSITRFECSELIMAQPGRTGQILRSHLVQAFAAAVSRGYRDDNPAEGTLRPDAVVQRERLTRAEYDAIHAAAPPWLQRAMQLSLLSLQRPSDLCRLDRDSWDGQRWHVRQSKSESAGYGLLRIAPHDTLRKAIQDCIGHPVDDCTRLIAHRPARKKKAEGRVHWAELSDQLLSRAFAALRDDVLPPRAGRPPSYYEIKALGARLYEEAGRPVEWIQALAGHQDAATTRIYTGRHADKWVDVTL